MKRLVLFGLVLFTSCTLPWYYVNDTSAYVESYLEYSEKLSLDLMGDVNTGDNCLIADFNYTHVSYAFFSEGDNLEKYNELCLKHGDVSYIRRNKRVPLEAGFISSITPDLSAISITADKDFGPGYPAGKELNDLFEVRFISLNEFVQSGYPSDNSPFAGPGLWKPLSIVTPEDLVLITPGSMWFRLTKVPNADLGPITLTVSCMDEEGRVISGTIACRVVGSRLQ